MSYYILCLVLYLFLNSKANESHYKIVGTLVTFISLKTLLPYYSTEDTILYLGILDSVTILTLLIVSKDKVTSTLIGFAVIPKIVDVILCNFSDGNVPIALLLMTLNADEYLVIGGILALTVHENKQILTKLHLDPRIVGYRVYILDAIFGMILLANLFY